MSKIETFKTERLLKCKKRAVPELMTQSFCVYFALGVMLMKYSVSFGEVSRAYRLGGINKVGTVPLSMQNEAMLVAN